MNPILITKRWSPVIWRIVSKSEDVEPDQDVLVAQVRVVAVEHGQEGRQEERLEGQVLRRARGARQHGSVWREVELRESCFERRVGHRPL